MFQTNEKRKQLLDEMSISIQTKKTESDSKIHGLEAELQDLNEKLSVSYVLKKREGFFKLK